MGLKYEVKLVFSFVLFLVVRHLSLSWFVFTYGKIQFILFFIKKLTYSHQVIGLMNV